MFHNKFAIATTTTNDGTAHEETNNLGPISEEEIKGQKFFDITDNGGDIPRGFYDAEMTVDEEIFDGDHCNLQPGTFVSFRYSGEYNGRGPPLNPKISLFIYHSKYSPS